MEGAESIVKENEYYLQDTDEASFPHYYGFTNETGEWYIIREESNGNIRYARASIQTIGEYASRWNDRTNLNYNYWWSSF